MFDATTSVIPRGATVRLADDLEPVDDVGRRSAASTR